MKPIFTAIFFFFFSTVAYTGHPDKDPVVNHLRSQFEEARVPSEDDLRLGENILCLQYYAAPGHYKVLQFPGLHNFRKVGGIIFHNNGSSLFKSFLIREQGLVGRTTSYYYDLQSHRGWRPDRGMGV